MGLAAEVPRILADKEFYSQGRFIAYAARWSTDNGAGKELEYGGEYADEIVVRAETFPANVGFCWHCSKSSSLTRART